MARSEVNQRVGHLQSLLVFVRPDHAAWNLVLRGALLTAVLGLLALAIGEPKAVLPLTLGSVFAVISETAQGSQQHPWRTMAWTTLGLAASAGVGAVVAGNTVLAVLSSGLAGLVCTLMAARYASAAVPSLLILVMFTIYVGHPKPTDALLSALALILLGGFLQTLACIVMRSLVKSRHQPLQVRPQSKVIHPSNAKDLHLRHGIRLAIVLMVATAISETGGEAHQYWLPMSAAWMSRVTLDDTLNRVIHRWLGTLIGLGAIGLILQVSTLNNKDWLLISLFGAALLIAYIWVHYAAAVVGVTLWIIAAFAMLGDPVVHTLAERLLDTSWAAALVLAAAWLDQGMNRSISVEMRN